MSSLIEMTLARCWRLICSRASIISGGATWLAASSLTSVSAGVAEITILAYGAIRCAVITSSASSPPQAEHDP